MLKTIEKHYNSVIGFKANLGSESNDFLHFQVGIYTELGELMDCYKASFAYGKPFDPVNELEELGDILWHVNLRDHLDKSHTEIDEELLEYCREQGLKHKEVLEYKDNYYSSVLEYLLSEAEDYRDYSLMDITRLIYALGHNLDSVVDANIRKLKARNKGVSFNADATINRNTEKERDAISN